MNIKDIPTTVGMFAIYGALLAATPVMLAAEGVNKLSNKALYRFENGTKPKK